MSAPRPNPAILNIAPYVGGEAQLAGVNRVIKLSSNEGAFGPPPSAIAAANRAAAEMHRYPDGGCHALRQAIGARFGLDPERIVCGAGSDELLALLIHAYAGPGTEVIMSAHGFVICDIASTGVGARVIKVPERNLVADVDAMLAAVSPSTRMVMIANPNNPTGSLLPQSEMERLQAGLPPDVLLLIDAAYSEYVDRPDYDAGVKLVDAGTNTVMTRTFSKIFGMGGLRLGWCYGPPAIIDVLNRARGPFNVNLVAQEAGVAALAEQHWVEVGRAHNATQRTRLGEALEGLGIKVWPSEGNFVLADFGTAAKADAADAALRRRGILVRAMRAYNLPHCLRITVGTAEECDLVAEALAALLDKSGMAEPVFRRLAVIGLGLIGNSVLRTCRERPGLAGLLVATDNDPAVLRRVTELGIADVVEPDLARAVAGADCVMLCAPVGAFASLGAAIAPHLGPGCVVTDTGSTKQSVIRDLGTVLPSHVHLVPAHPMAGTEFSGPDAGFATLFQGRYCLLTPLPDGDPGAVDRVSALWRGMGATTETMDPGHHDRVVAIVSHLPHLIAFTICGTADDLADESRQQVMRFAAAGFRDFTRIAASDPVMWRDVFLNNREALLEMLARFTEDAQAMARAVRWGDSDYISHKIERGRAVRRSLIELNQA